MDGGECVGASNCNRILGEETRVSRPAARASERVSVSAVGVGLWVMDPACPRCELWGSGVTNEVSVAV